MLWMLLFWAACIVFNYRAVRYWVQHDEEFNAMSLDNSLDYSMIVVCSVVVAPIVTFIIVVSLLLIYFHKKD